MVTAEEQPPCASRDEDETMRHFDDLMESFDRGFKRLMWAACFGFGGTFAMLGWLISKVG